MTSRSFSCLLVALFVLATGGIAPAIGQEVTVPSRMDSGLRSQAQVPIQDVTPAARNKQLKQRAQQTSNGGPYRYGKVIPTQFRPGQHGTWEQMESGAWLWRLRIRSDEAVSLSIGLEPFDLPPDAALFVHGPGDSIVRGPYTATDATAGQHQTPLVNGDEIVVEIRVPDDGRSSLNVEIDRVVHGFRAVLPSQDSRGGTTRKSASCNIDVVCEEGWNWDDQIRSVGRYTFEVEQDGQRFRAFCSGALVNNTGDAPRPFFLTAEHCVSTPEMASTMTFYWNYRSNICRAPGSEESGTPVPIRGQTSTGATLRARYGSVHEDGDISGKPDLTLVEVDDDIPEEYHLYLSGWDRSGATTDESVGIHHPAGDAKRISIDRDPNTFSGWGGAGGETHFRLEGWDRGTVQGGSSGSPMFDSEQRLVGVLSGGFLSGCAQDGADGGGDVLYGRITPGFEQGDYFDATLADFLDPENTGQTTLNGRDLSSDTEAPGTAQSFQFARGTTDSLTVSWTAPGDDGQSGGPASRYEVRYRVGEPITSMADFRAAQPVEEVPEPAAPGTEQTVTIATDPEQSYYFGLVAFDKVLQQSDLATIGEGLIATSSVRVLPVSPTPIRGQATTSVVVDEAQTVEVELYDALGRRVARLLEEEVEPFRGAPITIDASSLSDGMYFLRVVGETGSSTRKVPIVK